MCLNCLSTKKQVRNTSSYVPKSSSTQKGLLPLTSSVPQHLPLHDRNKPPVSQPVTSNSFQNKKPFLKFKFLPTTKGDTSWHELGRFHCFITHCCTGVVAMRGCTLPSSYVPSYFSPFQARLDKNLESTQREPSLVRLPSGQTNQRALHLLPYKKPCEKLFHTR